jgi:hypothetical protein
MVKPSPEVPQWQRASMRRLSWRASLVCMLFVLIAAAVAIIMQKISPTPGSIWTFVLIFPWIFAPQVIVSLAYRQGVKDAEAHTPEKKAQDVATPTI